MRDTNSRIQVIVAIIPRGALRGRIAARLPSIAQWRTAVGNKVPHFGERVYSGEIELNTRRVVAAESDEGGVRTEGHILRSATRRHAYSLHDA